MHNYTCGYNYWNDVKHNLSIAAIDYINSLKSIKGNVVDLRLIKKHFADNQIIHKDNTAIILFLNTYLKYARLMESLKLYGIYLLVSGDCNEIIYDINKSTIIESSIKLIKPYLKNDINEITTIFNHSTVTGIPVTIH